jgi:hypothetical protein
MQKFMMMIKEYGMVFVVYWVGVWAIGLAVVYWVMVAFDVDGLELIKKLELEKYINVDPAS